jgi:DNA processing protein
MDDDLLKYKIGIGLLPGIGSISAKKLIAYTGSVEAVFREKKTALLKIPGIGDQLADVVVHQNVLGKAEQEIEYIERNHIRYHFYLDEGYPVRLKNCEDGPVLLFYKGDVQFNELKVVSIVGTRSATDYGRQCCNDLVDHLKSRRHDVLVVSGLAYGIDICAHRAALRNGFDTAAVLGHGLGMVYPSVHKATAGEICKHGALVSEFISDAQPERNNFIRRNRLIAGLADVTIVVESALKGGALITADIAVSYNRDVLAFPGRNNDPYSQGCNWLIKTNKAALIERVEDLEYALGWNSPFNVPEPKQISMFVEVTEEERKIMNILQKDGQLPIDLLSIKAEMPGSKVSALLLNLEFAGLVRSMPGKIYRLTK